MRFWRSSDAGNPSDAVVFDASTLPLHENVSATRKAVEAIKSIDPRMLAEGEIGNVGSGSEIHGTIPPSSRNRQRRAGARRLRALPVCRRGIPGDSSGVERGRSAGRTSEGSVRKGK